MRPTHIIEEDGEIYEAANLKRDGERVVADHRFQGRTDWEGLGLFTSQAIITKIEMEPTHIFHVDYSFGYVGYEVVNPKITENGFVAQLYRVVGQKSSWTGPGGFSFHQTTVEACR